MKKQKSIDFFPEKYIIFDLETTGFSPTDDKIIEIGALKIENNEIVDPFSTLIDPKVEIGLFVTDLTGITDEMLIGKPNIEEVLPKFLEFVGGSDTVVVGHNVTFDIGFIKSLYSDFCNSYLDTLTLSRKLFPKMAHHRLKDMVKKFDISVEKSHRALADCEATFQCLNKIKEIVLDDNLYKIINFKEPKSDDLKGKNLIFDGKITEFLNALLCEEYGDRVISFISVNSEKSTYDSLYLKIKPTVYMTEKNILLGRIDKKSHFLLLKNRDKRMEIDFLDKAAFIAAVDVTIANDLKDSAASFGCCSKYKECSSAKKCLHTDFIYSKACQYRKNLENGNIFY